jgi:phosphoribosylformylglycinamidine synthase
MLLVAEKGREEEVFAVFRKWGLDAAAVGRVIPESTMRVLEHGKVVAEIPNAALTDEAPVYKRPLERWETPVNREMPSDVRLHGKADLTEDLKQLLASPNICSKRWITDQYESYVQLTGVQRPGGDAGVIRVKGTARGLAMALDGNGRWSYLDPKLGAMHAVAEACRNVAVSGATPVAATNCLNFGNPEKPHIMWQFSQVIDGMTKACEELDVPITGGNVSFYNETLGEGIYPTPVIGIVGVLEDVTQTTTPHFQGAGSVLLLLSGSESGDITDAEVEFGSSEYAKEVLGKLWGFPPALELEKEAALQRCVVEAIQAGLVESAHDVSEGGLAVCLAESGFRNQVGAKVELTPGEFPGEYLLFGEDASRIVVSCDRSRVPGIKQIAAKHGISAEPIGQTIPEKLEISIDQKVVVSASVSDLFGAWDSALERDLHVETEEHLVPNVLQKS